MLTNKKSLDLKFFRDILSNDDYEFVNLQYTDQLNEIDQLEEQLNKKIFIGHNIDCFNDMVGLLNLMKSCDCIISVSNSTTHLAGRFGIKTILLLPYRSGNLWYWYNSKNNYSSWYPSIKLLRQKKDLNWESVLSDLKEEIQNIT